VGASCIAGLAATFDRVIKLVSVLIVVMVAATACGSGSVEETGSPPATPPLEPTALSEPTVLPEPSPTAAPTSTPLPEPAPPEPAPGYDAPGGLVVPEPLEPGAPGAVIATEPLGDVVNATGQRFLYHSTSAEGDDIAVSGFIMYPSRDAPEQGWPLIAWAHGTTGLGDSCAPSHTAEADILATTLSAFGYAVVATDYEGLGTPGTHPYVVGLSEGHSVLDSVRAVQQLDLPITKEWVAFGHSQGGHAAMFTAQLQPTYAPELELIGTVAGAPPSQMGDLNDGLIGGDFQGYVIMTAAGLAAAYKDLSLEQVLSPTALDLIDVVESGCTNDIFEVYNPLPYDDLTTVENPLTVPGWEAAMLAQDTNQQPTLQPLLIIHGGEDEQIPVETSAQLFEQLCAFDDQGPTVRNVYPGQTHAGVLTTFAAVPDLLKWTEDRFAGVPAPDDCP